MAKLFTATQQIKLDSSKTHEERMIEGVDQWV